MKVRELIKLIENDFPIESAMSFDNSGSNIVDYDDEINNILVCLDVTLDSIEMAKVKNANLIISHHPMIFNEIKNINNDPVSKRIKLLNKYGISAYSCHTNYDVNLKYGMGVNLLNKIFEKDDIKSHKLLETYNIQNINYGIGDIIELNSTKTFDSILELLKSKLQLFDEKISFYKTKNDINKIIIIPGSGSGDIELVLNEMPDLIITSDLKHNNIIDLLDFNISYINATHYGLEKIFIDSFSNYLKEIYKNTNIFTFYNNNL